MCRLHRDALIQEHVFQIYWASLVAQAVKNPPAIQETQVQSLGREDPLEKGMATHSSILAWRIPWTGEPGGLQSIGSQSQTKLSDLCARTLVHRCMHMHTHTHTHTHMGYRKFSESEHFL